MPKLDGTHIVERLRGRLEQLQRGEEVAARDLRALLTDEQIEALDTAWAFQQELRKEKRARTKKEETELGWMSKRELHVEALQAALGQAEANELAALEERMGRAKLRQAKIYVESYFSAKAQDKPEDVARNIANNNLTRAGLARVDRQIVGHRNQRDRDVWQMEEALKRQFESEANPEEQEQLGLARDYEKVIAKNRKKQHF